MIQRIQNVFGRTLSETYQTNIAPFFDSHAILHLSALEQIRLGALPYVEAQTQYGFGDQVLMGVLTSAINYSAHGFYEAQMVVNALSIILFFVAIYYFIGFGWALLGLVGYSFLPSSWWVATFPGWAILSRWVGVGILGLVLAHVLLAPAWTQRRWLGVLLAGILWGAVGFLSQEGLTLRAIRRRVSRHGGPSERSNRIGPHPGWGIEYMVVRRLTARSTQAISADLWLCAIVCGRSNASWNFFRA